MFRLGRVVQKASSGLSRAVHSSRNALPQVALQSAADGEAGARDPVGETPRVGMARPVLSMRRQEERKADAQMKDLLFVAVPVAFFAVTWLYAKSFDHL
jgi:hypothetical protein